MLSIIISSYQPKYYNALEKNIAETCGIAYEIIKIDNPNLMGICIAYNLGAEKAIYNNLLFIHEDIIFHTQNWGEKIVSHLSDKTTGVLGIGGSAYIPSAPVGWSCMWRYSYLNMVDPNETDQNETHIRNFKEDKIKVFSLDGVLLSVTKEHFSRYKFDESLVGFHGYDIEFSLRISQNLQNYVIGDVLIAHFSAGDFNESWLDNIIKVRCKFTDTFQKNIDPELEEFAFYNFLSTYYYHYPVNASSILFTLKFLPFSKLKIKQNLKILRKYLSYIRYSTKLKRKL